MYKYISVYICVYTYIYTFLNIYIYTYIYIKSLFFPKRAQRQSKNRGCSGNAVVFGGHVLEKISS